MAGRGLAELDAAGLRKGFGFGERRSMSLVGSQGKSVKKAGMVGRWGVGWWPWLLEGRW